MEEQMLQSARVISRGGLPDFIKYNLENSQIESKLVEHSAVSEFRSEMLEMNL